MPRNHRLIETGTIYHVLNRANGRMTLFHKDEDFAAFEKVLGQGLERYAVDLLTYCLMGNHWHLLFRPRADGALSDLMRWIGVTHVRRHHAHFHTVSGGHLYQGRFKSFPVQDDRHFLTVARYVEANARRAGLTGDALRWPWGGCFARANGGKPFKLSPWPVDRPRDWPGLVNQDVGDEDRKALRQCVNRGNPFGNEAWALATAHRLNLMSTLRKRGRPRMEAEK